MSPLVRVRGLQFRYDDGTEALRGIDFDLYPGECVALFGANGSGKTTFALHLNGLLRGAGEIEVCGTRLDSTTAPVIRRDVGLVFQDSESQLFMPTVLEDVAFGPLNLGFTPVAAAQKARAALDLVGMASAAEKAPYHLSAGQKKRVAIAGVLAMEPRILVLDEPTTYLDPPAQRSLADLLRQLPQAKVLVTHDVAFARALCTRAVFFQNGKITAEGTPEETITRFAWEYVARRRDP